MAAGFDDAVIRQCHPSWMMDRLEIEVRRIVVVAAKERQPIIGFGKPSAAFCIKILVVPRAIKSKAAIAGHDDERVGHTVLYAAFVDELLELTVNVSAYNNAFGSWEFDSTIHYRTVFAKIVSLSGECKSLQTLQRFA